MACFMGKAERNGQVQLIFQPMTSEKGDGVTRAPKPGSAMSLTYHPNF